MIHTKYTGTITVQAGQIPTVNEDINAWVPFPPPQGAKHLAHETAADQPITPGLRARVKIGPFKITVTVTGLFTGAIEVWQS